MQVLELKYTRTKLKTQRVSVTEEWRKHRKELMHLQIKQ